MTGDIPLSIYSFEHAAIQEERFRLLIRPAQDEAEYAYKDILNFGGHRFGIAVVTFTPRHHLTHNQVASAGFKKDSEALEMEAAQKWLDDIGAGSRLYVYDLEPLERYSNEPLT